MLAHKGIFSRPSMAQSHESARWQRQKACIARLSAHIIPRVTFFCNIKHEKNVFSEWAQNGSTGEEKTAKVCLALINKGY